MFDLQGKKCKCGELFVTGAPFDWNVHEEIDSVYYTRVSRKVTLRCPCGTTTTLDDTGSNGKVWYQVSQETVIPSTAGLVYITSNKPAEHITLNIMILPEQKEEEKEPQRSLIL